MAARPDTTYSVQQPPCIWIGNGPAKPRSGCMAVRPGAPYSVERKEQQGTCLNAADRFNVAVVGFGIQHSKETLECILYNKMSSFKTLSHNLATLPDICQIGGDDAFSSSECGHYRNFFQILLHSPNPVPQLWFGVCHRPTSRSGMPLPNLVRDAWRRALAPRTLWNNRPASRSGMALPNLVRDAWRCALTPRTPWKVKSSKAPGSIQPIGLM